jgi:hypothetical protein
LIFSILLLRPSVQALVIFAVMALAMPRQWFLRVCAALRIGASREWVAHQCHFLKKAGQARRSRAAACG